MNKKLLRFLLCYTIIPLTLAAIPRRSIPSDMLGYIILNTINYNNLTKITDPFAADQDASTEELEQESTRFLTEEAQGRKQRESYQTKLPLTQPMKDQYIAGTLTIGGPNYPNGGALTIRAQQRPKLQLISGDDEAWAIISLGDTDKKLIFRYNNNQNDVSITPLGVVTAPTLVASNHLEVAGTTIFSGAVELESTLTLPQNFQILTKNGSNMLHQYNGASNIFLGSNAGNRTLTENGNTGIGNTALSSLTGGYRNTATGFQALKATTDGYGNTAAGAGALQANTTGLENTAIGDAALQTNTTASYSTAIGASALKNANATENVAIGASSLIALTTGEKNTAIGNGTLNNLTAGSTNVAAGYLAGSGLNGNNSNNIIIGAYEVGSAGDNGVIRVGVPGSTSTCYIRGIYANTEPAAVDRKLVYITDSHQLGTNSSTGTITAQGALNTTGSFSVNTDKMTVNATTGALNTAGTFTVNSNKFIVANDTGNTTIAGTLTMPARGQILFAGETVLHEAYDASTIFVGRNAGNRTVNGIDNTGCGARTLELLNTGAKNTAIGTRALKALASGEGNTAIGCDALTIMTTGIGNVGVGRSSLAQLTEGTHNTALGFQAGQNLTTTSSNNIYLGANQVGPAEGESNSIRIGVPLQSNQCFIGGIYNQSSTESPTRLVSVDSAGKLVTQATTTSTSSALSVTGDLSVGANTYTVTAATGSTTLAGNLTLSGTTAGHPELRIYGGEVYDNSGLQLYSKNVEQFPGNYTEYATLAYNTNYDNSRSSIDHSQCRLSLGGASSGKMYLFTSPDSLGSPLQKTMTVSNSGIHLHNVIAGENQPGGEVSTHEGIVPFIEKTPQTYGLRIIYGSINADGTIIADSSSEGFTSRFDTMGTGGAQGYYTVTFTTPFIHPPCITIGGHITGIIEPSSGFTDGTTPYIINGTLTASGFKAASLDVGVVWVKQPWHFIAIGV